MSLNRFFLLFLCFVVSIQSALGDTKAAAIIFRHGIRTPIGTYPNNPNKIKWPGGYGALTQKGSEQLFFHGQRLGQRYKHLVTSEWYSNEIFSILSSVRERCIMSAQSFMAGFLPPPDLNLPISWQPAAVISLSKAEDNMIAASAFCRKYHEEMYNYTHKPLRDSLRYLEPRIHWFKDLSDFSGKTIHTFLDAFLLYNILTVEVDNGIKIPIWAKEYLIDAQEMYEYFFAMQTATDFMKKVQFGGLLTDIIRKFNGVINETDSRKIFIYSGHDITVIGLAKLLEVDGQIPSIVDYGSTISLEMVSTGHSTPAVNAYFWKNFETRSPVKLKFPNCEEPCSFVDFTETYKKFMILPPETFESICAV